MPQKKFWSQSFDGLPKAAKFLPHIIAFMRQVLDNMKRTTCAQYLGPGVADLLTTVRRRADRGPVIESMPDDE